MSNNNKAVVMKGIKKIFPGTIANDNITLEIGKGEVHALLGENGAGKTTLMRILFGMYQADEGEILVNGKPVEINSPQDAMHMGIGMIHQHFTLVPVHTVVENVMLSLQQPYRPEEVANKIKVLGERYGLEVDPYAPVQSLPVGLQQRVEILKALMRKTQVMIMDEPSSVLTPQETEKLFGFIREFCAEGNSVIFITHKLSEVMEIADRITVLRDGKKVGSITKEEATEKKLANMMVGRDLKIVAAEPVEKYGDVILEVDDINVIGDRGIRVIENISFDIKSGQILGIAGVSGNGQEELAEAIAGLRNLESGDIRICGRSIANKDPLAVIAEGAGYILKLQ